MSFRPSRKRGIRPTFDSTAMPVEGTVASTEKGSPISVVPFWQCPRNLLVVNNALASHVKLVDRSAMEANILAMGALGLASAQFGLLSWFLGLQAGTAALWYVSPNARKVITSPELLDGLK